MGTVPAQTIELDPGPQLTPDQAATPDADFSAWVNSISDNVAAPSARKSKSAKVSKQQQANEDAQNILYTANTIVMASVGPEAAMSPLEYPLIVTPLTKMFETTEAFAKAANVANPLMLAVGLAVWGSRIVQVWRAKHPAKPKPSVLDKVIHMPQETPGGAFYVPADSGAFEPSVNGATVPASAVAAAMSLDENTI